ncbi:Uncharacterised protein [Mycobacteroides abscessus subsp. massiliense]|uniref:hypothetical protein n=1 Tax=Mycobacteroides abscessus TaxID=36809 RepID=UPI0009A6F037|nr:hypothetical protein [Mycobacteroides abscessus]SKT68224.1 Uncharacterised protein [Mycobacteroides abscessus subsp. massiliense]
MTTVTKNTSSFSHAAYTFSHLYTERRLLELLAEAADAVAGEALDLDLGDLLETPTVNGQTWAGRWAATAPVGVAEAYVIAELAAAGDAATLTALIDPHSATPQRPAPNPNSEVSDAIYALAVQAWSSWTADAATGFDADELLDLGADLGDLARWLAAARDRGAWSATETLALHIAGIAD